jgi:hypothetical protein
MEGKKTAVEPLPVIPPTALVAILLAAALAAIPAAIIGIGILSP